MRIALSILMIIFFFTGLGLHYYHLYLAGDIVFLAGLLCLGGLVTLANHKHD